MLAMLLLGLAVTPAPPPSDQLGTGFGTCDQHSHRHELELDANGFPTVYDMGHAGGAYWDAGTQTWQSAKQPDIVMDGLCHDNDTEDVVDDPGRRKLPVPSGEGAI